MHIAAEEVFLVSGDWRDGRDGLEIRFFGRGPSIGVVELVFREEALLFIDAGAGGECLPARARRESRGLRSMDGRPVDCVYLPTQRELRETAEAARRAGHRLYESDIGPCERFLMSHRINGQMRVSGEASRTKTGMRMAQPAIEPCRAAARLKVASLDIETGAFTGQLYCIGASLRGPDGGGERVFMLGQGPSDPLITYCEGEAELLRAFLRWFSAEDPDVIVGWNVLGFDLSFLDEKARKLGVDLTLGRAGQSARIANRSGYTGCLPGRAVMDVPLVLRRSFFSFEDYKLETVARQVLGRGKLIQVSSADKIKEIDRRFSEDKRELAQYNIEDCRLVNEIVERTGLLELSIRRVQISGQLLERIGFSTAAFDHFYIPRIRERGFVAPNGEDVPEPSASPGGFVFEPESGIHSDVCVLDFKSLYPSLMITFGIEPLSLMQADESVKPLPSGQRFRREVAVLPRFLRELMNERAAAAKAGEKELAQAIKILMNSIYGVMGSPGCRFHRTDLASAITQTGQWILMKSRAELERGGHKVIYGDTDSLFVQLNPEETLDARESASGLAKQLSAFWREKIERDFALESALVCDAPKVYRKLILPQGRGGEGGAKKRYAGLLIASDGSETLDFVGMEVVRSDWTALAKNFQIGLCERIFRGEDYESWIRKLVAEVRAGKLDGQLIYRKRMQKPIDQYTRPIPQYVKAARMLGERAGREVRYVITKRGPVPIELDTSDVDYKHYIEKQLKPIADSILVFLGSSFDGIVKGSQLSLL